MSELGQPKGDAERAVASGQKPATILVVDDHAPSRHFITSLLTYKGHRLLEASDGAAALARVRVERPDLVISDILMPTMDGYEFVRHICDLIQESLRLGSFLPPQHITYVKPLRLPTRAVFCSRS